MDSLRGIPVEHKLETFSMPSTGTPKIDYVDPSVTPLSTTWRYRRLSSKNQIQNNTVTLNTSLTRPTTRCHLNIPLSHFVSNTNKPKHHEFCSTKSKPYSKLQIKNFRCCVVKAKFRNSFVLPKKYSAKQITIHTAIYPYCSSILALAINNLWRLICHYAKKKLNNISGFCLQLSLFVS